MDPHLGRRETTRRQNRRTLLDAARRVFATVGVERATIRDIVRESGLSRGTFYNYLGDKETAFRLVAAELIEDIRQALVEARARATSLDDFVGAAFRTMVAVLGRDEETRGLVALNGANLRMIVAELGPMQGILSDLERDLGLAVDVGLLPDHPSPWLAAAMLGAAIEVVTQLDPKDDVLDAGSFLARLFLDGVRGL